MLVAAGQPVEIGRIIRDIAGEPFSPAALPAATASLNGAPAVSMTVTESTVGAYAARVPGAMLSGLGQIVAGWSWEYDGDPYTGSDAVGVTTVPVATLDDLDELAGSSVRVPSPAGRRLSALAAATTAFEVAVNDVFSPRARTETVRVGGGGWLPLAGARPRRVVSALTDDVALDPASICLDEDLGFARAPGVGHGTRVTISYEYGMDRPPDDVTRAVAILASSIVTKGPWDDRGYVVGDDGGTQRLLTAGVGKAMFSIPEVEACARRYRIPVIA